jgi:hypothetical protein
MNISMTVVNWPLLSGEVRWNNTGPEAIYVVDAALPAVRAGDVTRCKSYWTYREL